jgi:hypothetical protein
MSEAQGAAMKSVSSSAIVIAGAGIVALALAFPLTWFVSGKAGRGGDTAHSISTSQPATHNPADSSSTSNR